MPASPTLSSRLRAVAVLAILAGCAHRVPPLPRYVPPPASAATASLVMNNHLQIGDGYLVNVYADGQRCTGTQRVGASQWAVDPPATRLATDRWQTLVVLVLSPMSHCLQRWSFVPRAGHSYSLTTTSSHAGCSALVYDTTEPEAPRLESSLRKRDAEGRVCVPLATAKPIMANQMPDDSVAVADLPIHSDAREPSAPRPVQATPPGQDQVTADDLRGLIDQ